MLSIEFTNTYGDVGRVKNLRIFHPCQWYFKETQQQKNNSETIQKDSDCYFHWNTSGITVKKQCYFLIPLTFCGIKVTNSDFDKSHWNINGIHWFTIVNPKTF